jgi:DNA-binding CsgD family transcriptional regulator
MSDSKDALDIISRLLLAMEESNNPNDFCDSLCNDVLLEFNLVASYLAVVESDGRITMVGSWGYPPSRRRPDDRASLWLPMAITDTIRTGQVQLFKTWDEYRKKYPHLEEKVGPGKSHICIPFTTGGRRRGGLGLSFADDLSGILEQRKIWEVLAQAGGLFVNKSWGVGVFGNSKSGVGATMDEATLRSSLTPRDVEIIKLSVQGDTVNEIAKKLNFSESTIKQARISIYKRLGVSRAADLKHAALVLGIDIES